MKLIREEIEQVEIIVEQRNGQKHLYIEGVFLQGNIPNTVGIRRRIDIRRIAHGKPAGLVKVLCDPEMDE